MNPPAEPQDQAVDVMQLGRKTRRSRFPTTTLVVLAIGLLALGAWVIYGLTSKSDASRYDQAKATQETLLAIIENPAAFGTEQEVLDLLDELAIPDVRSGDLAFGGVTTGVWRIGWRNTLFGRSDATMCTWKAWLSDDGSVGGSLWTWSGTARNGEPFELQGLELSRFNDDGLYTEVVMLYPYEDAEVHRRINDGN